MVTMTPHCTEEVSGFSLPPVGIDVVLPPPPGLVVRHLAPPVLPLLFPLQTIQIILQLFTHLNRWVAFPATVAYNRLNTSPQLTGNFYQRRYFNKDTE